MGTNSPKHTNCQFFGEKKETPIVILWWCYSFYPPYIKRNNAKLVTFTDGSDMYIHISSFVYSCNVRYSTKKKNKSCQRCPKKKKKKKKNTNKGQKKKKKKKKKK